MSHALGQLVMQHRSEATAIATLDAFAVIRCFGPVTPDDVRAMSKCNEVVRKNRPDHSASIVVIEPSTGIPSQATRRTALEVARKDDSNVTAVAVVLLGDGFWASVVRSVLAALERPSHARKIFRFEQDGVDWAIARIAESPETYRAPLLAGLSALRSSVTSPPSPRVSQTPATAAKMSASSKRSAG